MHNVSAYILKHQEQGFDEMARNTLVSKEKIKREWNKLGLGWKMFPRTLIDIRRLDHGKYELLDDVKIYIAEDFPLIVPKGLVFDWASVPSFLWWFIAPDTRGIALPALLHDQLYTSELFDRAVCDALLLQGMKRMKFDFFRRTLAYVAVRMFGWIPWSRHKKGAVFDERARILKAMHALKSIESTARYQFINNNV